MTAQTRSVFVLALVAGMTLPGQASVPGASAADERLRARIEVRLAELPDREGAEIRVVVRERVFPMRSQASVASAVRSSTRSPSGVRGTQVQAMAPAVVQATWSVSVRNGRRAGSRAQPISPEERVARMAGNPPTNAV